MRDTFNTMNRPYICSHCYANRLNYEIRQLKSLIIIFKHVNFFTTIKNYLFFRHFQASVSNFDIKISL